MAVKLVLLHSPLVGPGTWLLLAPLLRAQGFAVSVPDFSPAMRGQGPYYPELVRIARAAIGEDSRDTILVVHSAAGALVPAIADKNAAAGTIFVDALLPHSGQSWLESTPEPLTALITKLSRDGRVPPWHRWWPKGAIETMFDDAAAYEGFAAQLNDLPLAYFHEAAPSIELSQGFACAYLRLGVGYEAEAATAENKDWPVVRLTLHHLAMLTHAKEAAAQIELLARALASRVAL